MSNKLCRLINNDTELSCTKITCHVRTGNENYIKQTYEVIFCFSKSLQNIQYCEIISPSIAIKQLYVKSRFVHVKIYSLNWFLSQFTKITKLICNNLALILSRIIAFESHHFVLGLNLKPKLFDEFLFFD